MGKTEVEEISAPYDGGFNELFKLEMVYSSHIMTQVYTTNYGIDIRKWVGKRLKIIVEWGGRIKGWGFQQVVGD